MTSKVRLLKQIAVHLDLLAPLHHQDHLGELKILVNKK